MKIEEVNATLTAFAELDFTQLDMVDQAIVMQAMENYAKAVKPIVDKYSPTQSRVFLFRM